MYPWTIASFLFHVEEDGIKRSYRWQIFSRKEEERWREKERNKLHHTLRDGCNCLEALRFFLSAGDQFSQNKLVNRKKFLIKERLFINKHFFCEKIERSRVNNINFINYII